MGRHRRSTNGASGDSGPGKSMQEGLVSNLWFCQEYQPEEAGGGLCFGLNVCIPDIFIYRSPNPNVTVFRDGPIRM